MTHSKRIFIACIEWYQWVFSPDTGILKKIGLSKGGVCVFYPTCSQYTKEAIIKYGVIKGFSKGLRRVGRCHPWQKQHIDPLV